MCLLRSSFSKGNTIVAGKLLARDIQPSVELFLLVVASVRVLL